jgi:glyoxylase I family protein
MMPPGIDGSFHVVLAVKNAARSAEWYCRLFGFVVVQEDVRVVRPDSRGVDTVFICTGLMHLRTRLFIALAQPHETEALPFDWRRVGLQHLGFHVRDRIDLDAWITHLDQLDISHSAVMPEGPGLVVRFHDLDDIPIEVFWIDWQNSEQLWSSLIRQRVRAARRRPRQVRLP